MRSALNSTVPVARITSAGARADNCSICSLPIWAAVSVTAAGFAAGDFTGAAASAAAEGSDPEDAEEAEAAWQAARQTASQAEKASSANERVMEACPFR